MCKINLDGTVVAPDSTKYAIYTSITSQADLLAEYAVLRLQLNRLLPLLFIYSTSAFDLFVNNSPAYVLTILLLNGRVNQSYSNSSV